MKFDKKTMVRILAGILILALILGFLAMIPMEANAAATGRKSYTIAIVYDNSGSMYKNEAWCQAKYAVEIFASMLDYSAGDELWLFPMWEVTTDGSSTKGGSYEKIKVTGKADIDKISNMYTTNPSNTPFAPVREAHQFLQSKNTDEKWLIVMTDGGFNQDKRKQDAAINLQGELQRMASGQIKVQYIGFGGASSVTPNVGGGLYVSDEGDSLQNRLIDTCNLIFQRNVLPADKLQGDKLTIDISTKNLVVFAQGADAKITGLKDSAGADVKMVMDSGQRKCSTISTSTNYPSPVDKSLHGQVVTFGACPKGEYTLSYSGADKDKIKIFYEPDVELKVTMLDDDGQPVDPKSGELVAGEYTVKSQLVDRVTGEDVSGHPLMGNVKIQTFVKNDGAGQAVPYPNDTNITLKPDQQTEIYVQADYLDKYSISTKDDKDAFSFNWKVYPALDFDLELEVQQTGNWYKTDDHDSWKPVKVTLTIDGQPLTPEQLQTTQFSFTTEPELLIRQEDLGNGAFLLHIAQNENGEYVEPEYGEYTLKVNATHTDADGRSFTESAEEDFDIQWYDPAWIPILIIIGILLLAALIAWILSIKCYPAKMKLHTVQQGGRGRVTRGTEITITKGNTVVVRDRSFQLFQADTTRNSRLIHRWSTKARVGLSNIKPGKAARELYINNILIGEGNETSELTNGATITVVETGNSREYQVVINQ